MEEKTQTNTPVDKTDQQIPHKPLLSSSRRLKVILFAVMGLFIIALSMYFGIYIGKTQKLVQKPATTQSQAASSQIESNTTVSPTIDPTSNWKTYTNKEYKFEFKYPENYHYKNSDNLKIINISQTYPGCHPPYESLELRKVEYVYQAQTPRISLYILNATQFTLESFINNCGSIRQDNWSNYCREIHSNDLDSLGNCFKDEPKLLSVMDIKNVSINAKKVVLIEGPSAPNNYATQIIFQKGDITYILQANYGSKGQDSSNDDTDESKDVENIFKTFRFTN